MNTNTKSNIHHNTKSNLSQPRRRFHRRQPFASRGTNLNSRVQAMNRWREYYNPLEHLSMRRVSALLHASQLGFWADLQWTYKFIEERDATLLALVERRAGALLQLDYDCLACAPDRLPKPPRLR